MALHFPANSTPNNTVLSIQSLPHSLLNQTALSFQYSFASVPIQVIIDNNSSKHLSLNSPALLCFAFTINQNIELVSSSKKPIGCSSVPRSLVMQLYLATSVPNNQTHQTNQSMATQSWQIESNNVTIVSQLPNTSNSNPNLRYACSTTTHFSDFALLLGPPSNLYTCSLSHWLPYVVSIVTVYSCAIFFVFLTQNWPWLYRQVYRREKNILKNFEKFVSERSRSSTYQ